MDHCHEEETVCQAEPRCAVLPVPHIIARNNADKLVLSARSVDHSGPFDKVQALQDTSCAASDK